MALSATGTELPSRQRSERWQDEIYANRVAFRSTLSFDSSDLANPAARLPQSPGRVRGSWSPRPAPECRAARGTFLAVRRSARPVLATVGSVDAG
jgi:hypothetical protein